MITSKHGRKSRKIIVVVRRENMLDYVRSGSSEEERGTAVDPFSLGHGFDSHSLLEVILFGFCLTQ